MKNSTARYQVSVPHDASMAWINYWPLDLAMILLSGVIVWLVLRNLEFDDPRLLYNAWTYIIGGPCGVLLLSILLRSTVSRVVEKSLQISFLGSVIIHLIFLIAAINIVIFVRNWPDAFRPVAQANTPRRMLVPEYFKPTVTPDQKRPDYLLPVPTEHEAVPLEPDRAEVPSELQLESVELPRREMHTPNASREFEIPRVDPALSQPTVADQSQKLDRQSAEFVEPHRQQLDVPDITRSEEIASSLQPREMQTEQRRSASESSTLSALEPVPIQRKPTLSSATMEQVASQARSTPEDAISPTDVSKSQMPKRNVARTDRDDDVKPIPVPQTAVERSVRSSLAATNADVQPLRELTVERLDSLQAMPAAQRPPAAPKIEPKLRTPDRVPAAAPQVAVTEQKQSIERSIAAAASSIDRPASTRVDAPSVAISEPTPTSSSSSSDSIEQMILNRDQVVARRSMESSLVATTAVQSLSSQSRPQIPTTPNLSNSTAFGANMNSQPLEIANTGPAASLQRSLLDNTSTAKSSPVSESVALPEDASGDSDARNGSAVGSQVTDANFSIAADDRSNGTPRAAAASSLTNSMGQNELETASSIADKRPGFPQRLPISKTSDPASQIGNIEIAETSQGAVASRIPSTDRSPFGGPMSNPIQAENVAEAGPTESSEAASTPGDWNENLASESPAMKRDGDSVRSSLDIEGKAQLGAARNLGNPIRGLAPSLAENAIPEILPSDRPTQRFRNLDPGGPVLSGSGVAIPAPAFERRLNRNRDRSSAADLGPLGPETEEAIERGLAFLAKYQRSDGSWRLEDFDTTVDIRSPCAATALALLAFQGAGYTHRQYEYAPVVQKGLQFLISNQRGNGDLYIPSDPVSDQNAWLYSHSIAALALSEAYGMTQDPDLKESAQKAVDFMVASQDKKLGGWRYRPGSGSDTSVTGWFMMALKSAQLAGLEVPKETFQGIQRWVEANQASNQEPHLYRYDAYAPDTPTKRHGRIPTPVMSSVGLLMRLHLGWQRDHPNMIRGAQFLLQQAPSAGTIEAPAKDTYYWYYGTQVLFHMGGEYWKAWNQQLHPLLIRSQVRNGEMEGSWEPLGDIPDAWGKFGGRLYVTTLNLLSLEVYYRHLPLYDATSR